MNWTLCLSKSITSMASRPMANIWDFLYPPVMISKFLRILRFKNILWFLFAILRTWVGRFSVYWLQALRKRVHFRTYAQFLKQSSCNIYSDSNSVLYHQLFSKFRILARNKLGYGNQLEILRTFYRQPADCTFFTINSILCIWFDRLGNW